MKIVIISQRCFPTNSPRSFRATELAKELVRQGHKVTLYALLGDYDYTDISNKTGIVFKTLGESKYGMLCNTMNQGQKRWHQILKKLGKPILFPDCTIVPMTKRAIKTEGDIDLLVTIAVPHIIHMGASFSNLSKVRCWVADCGDPFMGNPFHRPPFYFKWLEKRWCRKCNYICVPVEDAIKAYYPEFRDKIRVIPQGFDFANTPIADYCPNACPTFAYSGVFYKDLRDPSKFLEYLCTLENNFRFIVYTKGTSLLQPYMDRLGNRLEIRNYIPREQLIMELSKMDFLVNIPNNSGVQQPSKLIDYALTNRPILAVSTDMTDEEKQHCVEFLNGDYTHKYIVPDIQQYNIVNVASKFLALTK